ncbi:MAG: GNAT family N-acetyltransferase [Saprospiraceae bacterium]
MGFDLNAVDVLNNSEKNRFEVTIEGQTAICEYKLVKDRIIFTHTEVPPSLEGKGIASLLAKTGLEYAKAEQLKVMPLCPYVAGYIKRHPEYRSLLMQGFNV